MTSVLYTFKPKSQIAVRIMNDRKLGREFVRKVLLDRSIELSENPSVELTDKNDNKIKINVLEVGVKDKIK